MVCLEATMDADLDTLCTVVHCAAADLLPVARRNKRRRITDAELVTLCVAQAIMGIPSDRRFLAVARKHLVRLFPVLPSQLAYWKRRRRLADAIEWLMGVFASQSPGFLAPIRQRIESIFWTCRDVLILERHGARTPGGLA
jgi:hypothetical protein